MTEDEHLRAIDLSIEDAAVLMDLLDIDDEDEDARERAYEERFHCGTCMVRTVLETVWPSIQSYVDSLKEEGFNA